MSLITLQFTSSGLFSRKIGISDLLPQGMCYGAAKNLSFESGYINHGNTIAYHPDHIGRGIWISLAEEGRKQLLIRLPSPCTDEDIDDTIAIAKRILRKPGTDMQVNDKAMTFQELSDSAESLRTANLRVLHETMQNVLDGHMGSLILSCALHPLAFGIQEADNLWAGTDTHVYRDLMHRLQSIKAVYAQPQFYQSKTQKDCIIGIYSMASKVRCIMPRHPSIPLAYFDRTRKKFQFNVQEWHVSLYSTEEKKVIGNIPYEKIMTALETEQYSYYDADSILIEPISEKQLQAINELEDDIPTEHSVSGQNASV